MKDKFNILIIVLLLIVNAFFLYRYFQDNSKKTVAQSKSSSLSTDESKLLRGRILLQSRYGTSVVIDRSVSVQDSAGKTYQLQDFFKAKPRLVYFFTKTHCNSCIDEAMPSLDSLGQKVGYDKIMVLADLEDPIDLKIYRIKYNSHLSFYKIKAEDINTKAQELGVPFMFILNNDFKASYFFVIERTLPKVTQDYIHEMELVL